jgi:hypothetical protein
LVSDWTEERGGETGLGGLTLSGAWLNKYSGIMERAWISVITASGRNKARSTVGGVVSGVSVLTFVFALSAGWPLLTQSAMAMMVKLAATSIALGR